MSSRNEEFHEGNAFDGDSSEATLFSSPIKANETVDRLFEEIDKYCNQDQVGIANLSIEIDAYREDKTDAIEPLDEPVVVIIYSRNTQALQSKTMNAGMITVCRRYKVSLSISLCNPTTKMQSPNPP